MWRLACCAAFAGCGFQSSAAAFDSGDASVADGRSTEMSGPSDGGIDSSPADIPPCIQQWLQHGMDGKVNLSAPQLLPGFAIGTDDRDPWISSDGLQLYLSHKPGSHGGFDIYVATRNSVSDDFANPMALDNVNTTADENRPALSGDGLTLLFASNQNSGGTKIFITTRSDTGQPFPSPPADTQNLLASVNTNPAGTTFYDPFLSDDGLRLYLAPITGSMPQYLAMASRSAPGDQFTASSRMVFASVNSSSGEADPGLSADERVVVYSSARGDPNGVSSGTNLWFATRQQPSDPFLTPHIIPVVNSLGVGDDGDPVLSKDGCELYFASNRPVLGAPGGQYRLYKAVVQK